MDFGGQMWPVTSKQIFSRVFDYFLVLSFSLPLSFSRLYSCLTVFHLLISLCPFKPVLFQWLVISLSVLGALISPGSPVFLVFPELLWFVPFWVYVIFGPINSWMCLLPLFLFLSVGSLLLTSCYAFDFWILCLAFSFVIRAHLLFVYLPVSLYLAFGFLFVLT